MQTSLGEKVFDPGTITAVNKATGHSQAVVLKHYEEVDKENSTKIKRNLKL